MTEIPPLDELLALSREMLEDPTRPARELQKRLGPEWSPGMFQLALIVRLAEEFQTHTHNLPPKKPVRKRPSS